MFSLCIFDFMNENEAQTLCYKTVNIFRNFVVLYKLHLFESIFLISTIYNIHNIISLNVSFFINLLQTKIISKIHRFWVFLFYKITYCLHYENFNRGWSTNSSLVYIFMYPYCLQWADHKYWILFLCKTNFLIVWNCFKIMDIFFLLVT